MKYLVIIITIICAATAISLVFVWPEKVAEKNDIVVSFNGFDLTREEIQKYESRSAHHGKREDLINEIITKQVLIAEAQKLNIDKEVSFRLELKTFYEHSLIKILMERIYNEMEVTISDKEIDNYLGSFGKTYTYYTLKTSQAVSPETIKTQGEQSTELFDDLSQSDQLTLAALEPGQSSISFVTGNEKFAILLENISGDTKNNQHYDREIIQEQLLQAKKETQINNWIDDLRQQASITYHEAQE